VPRRSEQSPDVQPRRGAHRQGKSGLARPVGELAQGATAGCSRGEIAVAVLLSGSPGSLARCLASVSAHTPADVLILVAELDSADPANVAVLADFARGRRIVHTRPSPAGPGATLSDALAVLVPADVIVLRGDCVVGASWLTGLRAAAYTATHAASASALGNDAGILSVPGRNLPAHLPSQLSDSDAGSAVAAHALRVHPRIPSAVAGATYLRGDALELVGGLDASFASLEGAIADFSQRCVSCGLVHIAADDVFVVREPVALLPGDRPAPDAGDEAILRKRYPFFSPDLEEPETAAGTPLPAALARARQALRGLSVTIDGRCLVEPAAGTDVIVLETIRALAARERIALRVVVPDQLGAFADRALGELGVRLIKAGDAGLETERSDVVHRPFQVSGVADLPLLAALGERLVVTHLDLIAYDNASYFPSFQSWQRYRAVTRSALALADRVTFLSQHEASAAISEQLVDPVQSVVVFPGVTYSYGADGARQRPAGLEALDGRPFMVSVGSDLQHKNRVFALQLLGEMRGEHGWPGAVVFAGPRASYGSSAEEEARYLARNPQLAGSVITLPWIEEPEKAWLIENSLAVLHPSTREGLGLLPFEAAAHGRPCLFASTTALAELQPEGLATITMWDASDSARRVIELLGDPGRVAEHVRRTRERAGEFSWESAGERLVEVYEGAMAARATVPRRVGAELTAAQFERDEALRKYAEVWSGLQAGGQELLGPAGGLDEASQHTLLKLASTRLFRAVVLAPLRLLAGRRAGRQPVAAATAEAFDLHFARENRVHMAREGSAPQDLEKLD